MLLFSEVDKLASPFLTCDYYSIVFTMHGVCRRRYYTKFNYVSFFLTTTSPNITYRFNYVYLMLLLHVIIQFLLGHGVAKLLCAFGKQIRI